MLSLEKRILKVVFNYLKNCHIKEELVLSYLATKPGAIDHNWKSQKEHGRVKRKLASKSEGPRPKFQL